ncbi:MAG: AAA family ATPase [Candidatus Omnitrophica bacterium]|nr:AAA family ATPase [Candidatus Omnitrophota bacterium]
MTEKKTFKNIFLSSIHKDAGKTTLSLGLYKAFKDRKIKTAFMKPVGQEVVNVGEYNIDKDSYLMAEVYKCGKRYREMSPVTIGKGFTEKYIFHPEEAKLKNAILHAFKVLVRKKEAIIVEGTGHAGVGSVVDVSNAVVAKILGSKVIIISEGGIGKSIDEIMLNKALFDMQQVEVAGVIVNKVLPEKYDKIKEVLGKGLENKGIRLLGVLPLRPLLSSPTMEQVQNQLQLQVLCGKDSMQQRVKNVIVAAMEPHNMVNYLEDGTMVLASGDRIDNVLLAVSSHLVRDGRTFQVAGIILTGGLMPNDKIIDLLKKSSIPVLITEEDTYTVAARVEHLICKIQKTDKDKIQEITNLVNKYVDVDKILASF